MALRVAKSIRIRERMHVNVTADFFNLFNLDNVVFIGGTPSPFNPLDTYGPGVSSATGAILTPNASFRQLQDPSFCSSNKGCYNKNATPGSPFTAQLGLRFQFYAKERQSTNVGGLNQPCQRFGRRGSLLQVGDP